MFLTDVLLFSSPPPSKLDFALKAPNANVVAAYRADSVSGVDMTDRLGGGYDTSSLGNDPTVVSDGGTDFNNSPVIRYNGSNNYSVTTTPNFTIGNPVTVLFVGKLTLNNGFNKTAIMFKSGTSEIKAYHDDKEYINMNAGVELGGPLVSELNTPRAYEFVFDGSSSSLVIDHIEEATGNTGTNTITSHDLFIGGSGAGEYWGGDIAEVIIIDGILTAADRLYWAKYLVQRYGFDAWTLRQTASANQDSWSTGSNTLSASFTSSPLENSLLVCTFGTNETSITGTTANVYSTADVFSETISLQHSSSPVTTGIFHRVSGNSDPTTISISFSDNVDVSVMHIQEWICHIGTPTLNGTPKSQQSNPTTSAYVNGFTPDSKNALLLSVHAFDNDGTSISDISSDLTEEYEYIGAVTGPDISFQTQIYNTAPKGSYDALSTLSGAASSPLTVSVIAGFKGA